MHLTCPHCHNPIEVLTAAGGEEVLCPSCGSTFRLETESTASWRSFRGRQLGRFELIEAVGVGAFGSIYKARDPQLDRVVAIKIPRAGNLAEKADLDRFLAGRLARRGPGDGHSGLDVLRHPKRRDLDPVRVGTLARGPRHQA